MRGRVSWSLVYQATENAPLHSRQLLKASPSTTHLPSPLFFLIFLTRGAACWIFNCFFFPALIPSRTVAFITPQAHQCHVSQTSSYFNKKSCSVILPAVTSALPHTQEIGFTDAIHQAWTQYPINRTKVNSESIFVRHFCLHSKH